LFGILLDILVYNLLTIHIPDEDNFRNVSCALNQNYGFLPSDICKQFLFY